jgi:hypothetical protein
LFNRALITTDGTDWFVAAEGYDALGRAASRRRPPSVTPTPISRPPCRQRRGQLGASEKQEAAKRRQVGVEGKPRTRENSKQAEVIRMLQRPEGATIGQICTATGWQAHTVRGTFAGAFKKKLGLTIVSDKPQGGERVYRGGD